MGQALEGLPTVIHWGCLSGVGCRICRGEERSELQIGPYPNVAILEPEVRVSSPGVKRWDKNKFKDVQASTPRTWLLLE